MSERLFGITYFNKLYENQGEYFELSLEELNTMLSKKHEVQYKNNAPGFIAGRLEDNSKEMGKIVYSRSCLAVDFDHIRDMDSWFDNFDNLFGEYTYMMYTSFSHSKLEGKVRVIIPLEKDITPGQYSDFINNIFCYSLNKEIAQSIDKTTHESKRFMYCHSTPIGGSGFYYNNSGKLLDLSWYPYGEHSNEREEYEEIEALYPTYKEAIESFNQKYPGNKIYSAIKDEEYIEIFNSIDIMWFIQTKLSKIYIDRYKNRFKYYKSNSGMCGAVVYNNSLFSNHDSDPACNGHTHSCFSLLKIHLCDNTYISALNHIKRLLNPRFYE